MSKVNLYSIEGKKTGDITLPEAIFGMESNDQLVHQVYTAQAANRRSGSAHTKIRSEVRGGGRKPWKQKGTGNARTGSIRNPIWRGGGTIFGPLKGKNYSKDINVKMRRKALLIALSEKARAEKVIVADTLALPEVKTKNIASFLEAVGAVKSTLISLVSGESETYKAARNIQKVKAFEVEKLNVYDVMNSQYLVISQDGLKKLEEQYAA